MATTILERTPRSVTVRMSTGRWKRIQQLEHTYRMANTIKRSTFIMETRTFKSDVAAFFKKMQADKQALNACIREGRDIQQEARNRGITLSTPI